jgi:hypothetical protein
MSDPTADPALQKLVNLLGAERAETVVRETLQRIGLETLNTPDDRYRFAKELLKQGGALGAVGRAMRIQAILHGASEDAA